MESATALNQHAIVANYMSTQNAADSPIVQFWHVMLKRRWTVIACFVIVVTLAAIASFKMTPLYMASAQMAINRENSEFLGFKNLSSPMERTRKHRRPSIRRFES